MKVWASNNKTWLKARNRRYLTPPVLSSSSFGDLVNAKTLEYQQNITLIPVLCCTHITLILSGQCYDKLNFAANFCPLRKYYTNCFPSQSLGWSFSSLCC